MSNKLVTLKIYKVDVKYQNTQGVFNLAKILEDKLLKTSSVKERLVRNSIQDDTEESDAIIHHDIKDNIVKGMIARIKVGNALQIQKEKLEDNSFTLKEVAKETDENVAGFIKQSLHFIAKNNYIAVHHRNDMQRGTIETYLNAFFSRTDINLIPIIKKHDEMNLLQIKNIMFGNNMITRALNNDESKDKPFISKSLKIVGDVKDLVFNELINNKGVDSDLVSDHVDITINFSIKKPKKESEQTLLEALKITDPSNIVMKTRDNKMIKGSDVELKSNPKISVVDGKYLNDNEVYRNLLLLIENAEN